MLGDITAQLIERLKEERIGANDVEEFLMSGIISGAAALVALSPLHEEEGVYEVNFSFKLNAEEWCVEPLGGIKVEKLRGKTND